MGYKAKHAQNNKKAVVLVISLLLLLCFSAGGTLAYLITSTDEVENVFTPSEVDITVKEELAGNVKKNVQIKNTGNTDAYIRARVVVTWQDEYGNVYSEMPVEETHYKIDWKHDESDNDWVLAADGYYYHKTAVSPGNLTGVLFTNCAPEGNTAPEGYKLHVEILAQAIQSKPATAVDSWDNNKVNVTGNEEGTALTIEPKQSSTN